MARALDDPKGIAAASPVAATTGAANTGTAAIASLAAVSPSINPNLTATITFTDDLGNYSYSLVDTTGALPTVNGTGSFVAGQPIALNGFELQPHRRAEARRLARSSPAPPSRRATTATPMPCSACATAPSSASRTLGGGAGRAGR